MAEAETTTEVEATPDPNLLETLADGTKIKRRVARQRACNEPLKKNICAGHLKRWYEFGDDVKARLGPGGEVYRCERCQTLYLPNEEETPRTGTLAF
jgi:hypothetical protein